MRAAITVEICVLCRNLVKATWSPTHQWLLELEKPGAPWFISRKLGDIVSVVTIGERETSRKFAKKKINGQ